MEKWFFSPNEAGTDEAGRGCLAGPVTAAAVILPEDFYHPLLNDPDLILADEPTGNLDPETSVEIMKVMREINDSGRSILMATHDYALILKFPSKTIKCDAGKLFEVVQRSV